MLSRMPSRLAILPLAAVLWLGSPLALPDGPAWLTGAAWADDHGGGDDDGDDGGDDAGDDASDDDGGEAPSRSRAERQSGGAGSGTRFQQRRTPRAPGQPAAVQNDVVLARFAPAELVVTDLGEGDLQQLLGEGYAVSERQALTALGITITRLQPPPALSLDAAVARVRQLPTGLAADLNHFYRTDEAPEPAVCDHGNCVPHRMVDWPADRGVGCQVADPIGVIDTGINPDHDLLEGARITRESTAAPSAEGSRAVHGTAVVSLLVGQSADRVLGLVPEAQIFAIDAFSVTGGDERADIVSLVLALDSLANRGVRLINLSISGPPNVVLTAMIDRLTQPDGLDAVIVAAAGNGGPEAAPAYPAAHPAVLAVSAVDARGRAYAWAQRGDHLDLAAPGVNLLAATSIRGARAQTGTSFAVPFVTAAAAVLLAQTGAGAEDPVPARQIAALLRATARDLGAAGPDAVFGHGLLSATALCPAEAAIPDAAE